MREGMVGKPRNPFLGFVKGSIKQTRALGRQSRLHFRNVLQMESKDAQPIGKAIAGHRAEREDLGKAGREAGKTKVGIELMGDVELRIAVSLARLLGQPKQGHSATLQDASNKVREIVPWGTWGHEGSREIPETIESRGREASNGKSLSAIADKRRETAEVGDKWNL
jgi:hypothetical protein